MKSTWIVVIGFYLAITVSATAVGFLVPEPWFWMVVAVMSVATYFLGRVVAVWVDRRESPPVHVSRFWEDDDESQ